MSVFLNTSARRAKTAQTQFNSHDLDVNCSVYLNWQFQASYIPKLTWIFFELVPRAQRDHPQ
jgi:hypothetical protein